MNNIVTSCTTVCGLVLGCLLALLGTSEHNRHFTSNTVTHIEIEDDRKAQSISLPLRFELTLKENQTYGVFAMLPSSQVGFSGKGAYTHNHQGMMFIYDTHTPLELDDAKDGLVEQLFVRPGAFDGRMKFVELGNDHAILVGHKVALYLKP
ncbi:hypothetical protein [Vibrio ouci]|uniref:Uncharacterized protein n=1 Tax=Vibrio ouci TaxID=2499078 RepID=A0A4Y8WCD4_9VIBR|nr:hypothetical protein [Vibrio ouci]TFH89951.1 hypothetical protein ELS82_19480 [Vibrio ouci]